MMIMKMVMINQSVSILLTNMKTAEHNEIDSNNWFKNRMIRMIDTATRMERKVLRAPRIDRI